MMRAARKDANHNEIADYFIAHGCSVGDLSQVKRLCDMVVGYKGLNELVEIKDGSKPPSAQKLTEGEAKFHREWLGTITVITSIEDAAKLITIMKDKSRAMRDSGALVIR